MRPRKYHPNRSVLFVTFSVEEGLLFLANSLCLAIVKSCLAAAQELYPVTISHFIVQATHLHLLLVVNDPEDVKNFVRHFKTESAHLMNNLLGRTKRTIWCEGYDSPVVLDVEKALSIIAYIYANPVKDNLIETIDAFPGLSSWKMFLRGEHTKRWKRLRRPAVVKIQHHSSKFYAQESSRLLKEATSTHNFRIEPDAWMRAFGVTNVEEQKSMNQLLLERVRSLEKEAAENRQRKVIGRDRLIHRSIDVFYQPEREGRRTWCLSENRSMRVQFINFLKTLYQIAKDVAERWKIGDFSVPFPAGLYPPSAPKLCEPISQW